MRVTVEAGTQRVMRILVTQLGQYLPAVRVVQSQGVFEPNEDDLPLVRLSWRQRSAELLTRMEYPAGIEAIPSDYAFTPKATGKQKGETADIIEDGSANFTYIKPGDKAVNRTKKTVGTVTEIISTTKIKVTGVTFVLDDVYEVHWPIDAEKYYAADRRAILEMDIYAAANASYETGTALDNIERQLVQLWWTRIRDALQAEYVEVESVETVSDASSIISSGLGADWYERAILEVSLIVGDGMALRRPTVESIPVPLTPSLTEEGVEAGLSGFDE